MRKSVSTRVVLIGLVAFNVAALGLSEMQKRALAERSSQRADASDRILGDLLDRVIVLQAQLPILTSSPGGAEIQEKSSQVGVASLLVAGRPVTVRLDNSPLENVGADGRTVCGDAAAKGYLGNFIAGREYLVRYDLASNQWTVRGPNQAEPFDPDIATCREKTFTYGAPNPAASDRPEAGAIFLWGERFTFRGLNLYLLGNKVGQVILRS